MYQFWVFWFLEYRGHERTPIYFLSPLFGLRLQLTLDWHMYTFCEWQGMTSLSSFWRADSFGCPEDSIFWSSFPSRDKWLSDYRHTDSHCLLLILFNGKVLFLWIRKTNIEINLLLETITGGKTSVPSILATEDPTADASSDRLDITVAQGSICFWMVPWLQWCVASYTSCFPLSSQGTCLCREPVTFLTWHKIIQYNSSAFDFPNPLMVRAVPFQCIYGPWRGQSPCVTL